MFMPAGDIDSCLGTTNGEGEEMDEMKRGRQKGKGERQSAKHN